MNATKKFCKHIFLINHFVYFESETENTGFNRKIPREIYKSSNKRQKVIDDLK